MRKLLLAIAALTLAVVAAAALVAGRLDPEDLARRALAGAGERSGMRLTAGHIDWTRRGGLVLDDVTLAGGLPAARVEMKVPIVVIEHGLWPLLRNRLAIDRVVLEGADIVVRQRRPAQPTPAPRPAAGGAAASPRPQAAILAAASEPPPRVSLGEIEIRHSTLRLHDASGVRRLLVVGMTGALRDIRFSSEGPSDLRRVTGQGELALDRIDTDNLSLENVATSFHLADGRLDLEDLRAEHETGSLIDGHARLGLEGRRGTFRFEVRFDDLRIDRLLDSPRSAGETAPARLALRGSGFLDRPWLLEAEGTLGIGSGALPPLPALASIDETLGTRLDGARYEATDVRFERLPSGRIELAPFELVAASFVLRAEGALKPDRSLAIEAAVGLSPTEVKAASPARAALDLLVAEGDRQWVPLRVTGPLDEPRTVIDRSRARSELEQAARRRLDEQGDRIKETLGEELGEKLVRKVEKLLDGPD